MSEQETEPQGPLTASIERMRKELDYWLSQGGKTLDRFGIRSMGMGRGLCPAVDVIESAEKIEVIIDLPGVDPQAVNLTLAGNMLTVEADKAEYEASSQQTVHLRERLGGRISRSIPMPASVDPEKVTADAIGENGTLRVQLEKSEHAMPRQIKINTPSPGGHV